MYKRKVARVLTQATYLKLVKISEEEINVQTERKKNAMRSY